MTFAYQFYISQYQIHAVGVGDGSGCMSVQSRFRQGWILLGRSQVNHLQRACVAHVLPYYWWPNWELQGVRVPVLTDGGPACTHSTMQESGLRLATCW